MQPMIVAQVANIGKMKRTARYRTALCGWFHCATTPLLCRYPDMPDLECL